MKFIERISNPQIIWSIVVFVFWIGATWGTLKSKINSLNKRMDEFDGLKLESLLAKIQTDLERIKRELKKNK